MTTEITIAESEMKVLYRVVNSRAAAIFETEFYASAEEFCWKYDGNGELEIKKLWVPRE